MTVERPSAMTKDRVGAPEGDRVVRGIEPVLPMADGELEHSPDELGPVGHRPVDPRSTGGMAAAIVERFNDASPGVDPGQRDRPCGAGAGRTNRPAP